MGREAQCECEVGPQRAAVKALLESTVLVLRGAIPRRYDIAALADVRVADGRLRFSAGGEPVALMLGDAEAARWAKKLLTPPPSLAAKLGVGPASLAFVMGRLDDPALAEALHGVQTDRASEAGMLVAVVGSSAELAAAVETHHTMPCRAVWVVHPKGRDASLGDAEVRQTLRAQGYVDNKTSAVSSLLTATRYARR